MQRRPVGLLGSGYGGVASESPRDLLDAAGTVAVIFANLLAGQCLRPQ